MESLNLDWLDDNYAFDFRTPDLETCDGPGASPTAEPAEPADPPSGEHDLPLLRLDAWDRDKEYNKKNPECIHYDFRWKLSQRENIRARQVCTDSDPDLVLAPSDYWEVNFQERLEGLLGDKNKFPGDNYACEETNVVISIERSRQRGLTKQFKKLDIDWKVLDSHLEGLGPLFSKGRKITFFMEFVYREATTDATATRDKRKKKNRSATDAQKAQRAADAGLWSRVYKHHRCRGKHCKQGPHCWKDERGNHHRLLPRHLEEIFKDLQSRMKEGEKADDVDINVEIPPAILRDVMDDSRKRKAESSVDCRPCKARCEHRDAVGTISYEGPDGVPGDREVKLEEYCNWTLTQVASDRWRTALQAACQFAMDQFMELNSMLMHPKVAADLMVAGGVKPGIALQFVGNVQKFLKETWHVEV